MSKISQTNYSVEEFTTLVKMYADGAAITEIATALGKTERSVLSKLIYEGLYKVPVLTRTLNRRVFKKDLIQEIATTLNIDPKVLQSLEAAKIEALSAIVIALEPRSSTV